MLKNIKNINIFNKYLNKNKIYANLKSKNNNLDFH